MDSTAGTPTGSSVDALRPRAAADYVTTPWANDVWFAVLDNDTDPLEQILTLDYVRTPRHGVAEATSANRIAYRAHEPGFAGVDSFYYVVKNEAGKQDSARIYITVLAPSPAPLPVQLKPDSGGAWGGTSGRVNVVKNIGQPGWFAESVLSVNHGTVRLVGDSLEYMASRTFTGLDTVVYRIANEWRATTTRIAVFHSKNPDPAFAPTPLTVVPIVAPSGSALTPTALNRVRGVTGYATLGSGETHAFRWTNGQYEDLGLAQGQSSRGYAINDNGVVGGQMGDVFSGFPVLWLGSSLVPSVGSTARGVVRGLASDGTVLVAEASYVYSLWRDGVEVRRGPSWIEAFAINQRGDVLCRYVTLYSVACVQDAEHIAGFRGAGRWSDPVAINNAGDVLYYAETQTNGGAYASYWIRTPSDARIRMEDRYPNTLGVSAARSLADDGAFLCASQDVAEYAWAVCSLGGRFPIDELLTDRSWHVTNAVQMAANGDIVAIATNSATGYSGPVLLTR